MPPKGRRRSAEEHASFGVLVDRRVNDVARDSRTPREVRRAFADAYEDFRQRGCEAATYRLSGPDNWPRFCVRRLPRNYRLIVIFPDAAEVRLVLLEEHSNETDPYTWLEEALDLPNRAERVAEADAGKPVCCDDRDNPPDGSDLGELIDEFTRGR